MDGLWPLVGLNSPGGPHVFVVVIPHQFFYFIQRHIVRHLDLDSIGITSKNPQIVFDFGATLFSNVPKGTDTFAGSIQHPGM